ncbi:glycosyltransferase [Nocardioides ganghwensis]|uniref:Glycosyltransferase n=1 Tax=Nocardioides ganghwensis TaxID=252230 RepID=A0A4Q2SD97_9ACTN|nr:glycosyltransferase [Nocardioides ganghwensis]
MHGRRLVVNERAPARITITSHVVPPTPPSLSVVLIVLNGAQWIAAQLDALALQREAPEAWEVVVSDNGSTDGTQTLVMSYGDSFPVPLRLVDASSAPGVSHARNVGASAAEGHVLLFCDCDDIVSDTWVRDGYSALQTHVCVVGTSRVLEHPHNTSSEVLNPDGLVGRGIHGCNFGVRRDVYFAVGGFDESLPPYGCDDSEFSIRLRQAGHAIEPADGMVLYFRRTTGVRRTLRKVYLSAIAETVVWQRHPTIYGSRLTRRAILGDLMVWPIHAVRRVAAERRINRDLARSAVTAWAHVVGYLTWTRTRRAGEARLVFRPLDLD